MAVVGEVKNTKVVLKLEEGTQTISNCSNIADDQTLYKLGQLVSSLQQHTVEGISKVVETTLVEE